MCVHERIYIRIYIHTYIHKYPREMLTCRDQKPE